MSVSLTRRRADYYGSVPLTIQFSETRVTSPLIDDPADSPFNRLIGFTISEWRDGEVELTLELRPELLNRSGILHGGVLATLIDAAGGFSGCYSAEPGRVRRALSLSLTTNFTGQSKQGLVRVVGRKRAGGRKVFFAGVEVFNDAGELIATGVGTYRYRSGSEPV